MSDRRHRATRPALPEGYQYGDAGKYRFDKLYGAMCSTCWTEMIYQPVLHAWVCETCPARICLPWTDDCFRDGFYRRSDGVPFATPDGRLIVNLPTRWRAPHENAAAQLKRRQTHLACPDLEERTGENTI